MAKKKQETVEEIEKPAEDAVQAEAGESEGQGEQERTPFTPKEWNVEWRDPNELTPYAKNARRNDQTVPYLVNSIKRFGFKIPLVVDKGGVVVCGHTRLKAALQLGYTKVPCVKADDLTDEEIKAFRLADNKIQEISGWDNDILDNELLDVKNFGINMDDFGFGGLGTDWGELDDVEGEQTAPTLKGANNVITVVVPLELVDNEMASIKKAVENAIKGWAGCEVK